MTNLDLEALGDEAANRPRALLGLRVLEKHVVRHAVEGDLRRVGSFGAGDRPEDYCDEWYLPVGLASVLQLAHGRVAP